ncbi:MAG: UDP-N-acetylglucosamine 1-carboxyvinyltransferase, partial [Actinomycetes bacterium]
MTQTAWFIEPCGPLRGDVAVRGSKNGVTKHMVAAVMGSGTSTITNAPDVGDVGITAEILQSLGIDVARDEDSITIEPTKAPDSRVPLSFSGLNRIPILLLGPLLHRAHEAFVPLVGGDRLGRRPVDFHVSALQQMGAEVEVQPHGITARMAGRLRGARITLPYPSVGATETVLLSAVLAEGRTVIHNAATEPEVVELALFLQRMGAHIALRPDRRFVIEGVESLKGAEARLQGDRLEAFSYLAAGLMTGGQVRVGGCAQDRLVTAINTLHRMGARVDITDDWVTASVSTLRPAAVQTDTHPGFMTDWQPPLIVLMTQADGMSVLHETVYEDRLGYVDAVKAMGGEIELF